MSILVADHALDFLAQLNREAKEFVGVDKLQRTIGQLVMDVLLQAEQPVQFFFARAEEFLLRKLMFNRSERLDVGGEFAVPIDEGAFGDVEFGGDVTQGPALGAEFDEFVLGIS